MPLCWTKSFAGRTRATSRGLEVVQFVAPSPRGETEPLVDWLACGTPATMGESDQRAPIGERIGGDSSVRATRPTVWPRFLGATDHTSLKPRKHPPSPWPPKRKVLKGFLPPFPLPSGKGKKYEAFIFMGLPIRKILDRGHKGDYFWTCRGMEKKHKERVGRFFLIKSKKNWKEFIIQEDHVRRVCLDYFEDRIKEAELNYLAI